MMMELQVLPNAGAGSAEKAEPGANNIVVTRCLAVFAGAGG